MSDPIVFPNATPALGLPLLMPGQAQKEFFVNQALAILDAAHLRIVLASQPSPPASPSQGDCFRVTSPAAQAWAGCENHVAIYIGGDWHFIGPQAGMEIFDQASGHLLVFRSQWVRADAPAVPSGGSVVDTQARAAIGQLIQSLVTIGILKATGT